MTEEKNDFSQKTNQYATSSSESGAGSIINVKDYGATGDGITNDLTSIQDAVDAASPGTTIYFPRGVYWAPRHTSDDDQYYVMIQKDGIRLTGDGESTVFQFSFKVKGGISEPVDTSGSFGSGDNTITLSSALNVNDRDWIQLWGVCHPFSKDAGTYQLGGYNPTKDELYKIRFGEFVQVRDSHDQLSLSTMSPIVYPKYQDNTSDLTETIDGVTSAQAVKVNFINGFRFDNVKCEVERNSSFDRYKFYYVKGLRIDNINFQTLDNEDGRWLRICSCLDVDINNCQNNRDITGYTGGASWNSYIIGAGSMEVSVRNCTFRNQAQTIDFTPAVSNRFNDDFPGSFVGNYIVYTNVSILNCNFINCSDAATTHPGGWGFIYQGNAAYGNGGLRARTRNNLITNNRMESSNNCITFSAFYDDSLVTNNLFIKPKFENRSLASKSWNAIFFSNFGSETNNKNSVKSVVVAGNSFINKSETQPAIQFRQYGNGVNPTTGKEMTNSEKISKSNITIMDNTFSNCNIHSFPYWNGIEISRNRFYGKSGNGYIEISKNCGGWRIVENFFERKNHIVLPPSLNKELAWPRFTIAENFARGAVNIENEDIIGKQYNYFTTQGAKKLVDNSDYSSGKGIFASRQSGYSQLLLDSRPLDETSDAIIQILANSPTNGIKRVYSHGRIDIDGWCSPLKDSVYSLGNASRRWSEIYSENGVIKTSDEREKQKIRDISTAEKKIAHELKKHIHAFKWEDAIEEKGSQARWHFGIMAQTVKDLFSKHGLDATQYGLFCYDEWKEQPEIRDHETGNIVQEHLPSGSRYGIRYDQLLAFIIAAI